MKILQQVTEQLQGVFGPTLGIVKRKIFGVHNERLDFIMDSFYKLTASQQKGVLAGASALLFVIVLSAFGIYFSKTAALEAEVNDGFEALHRMRLLGVQFKEEKQNLVSLKQSVDQKMARLRPKAFFEQKANEVGVSLESLRSEESEILDSPLGKDFKHVNVEFRLPKVSIPRMLKFFGEIEKSGKNMTIRNLTIRARYGDRLYFDTQARVVGFKVN